MNKTKKGIGRSGPVKILRYWPAYLMLLPGFVYLLINNYIPMAGIVIAFKNFNYQLGMWKSPWTGFSNFEFLFRTSDAWLITRNTLLYNLTFIVLGTVLAILVSVSLNEIRSSAAKKVYQTSVLIPYLISMVIASFLVNGFLNSRTGFLNKGILEPLGMEAVSWYSEPQYWPFILVIVYLWKNLGYQVLLYYAALISIDREYYEAAVIDGAGRWKQFLHITLPGLKTTIITLTLLAVGRIFYSDFGLFYQIPMDSGVLLDVTNTIDLYVYHGLMESNNIGMSSAAGVYQSMVGFVLAIILFTLIITMTGVDFTTSLGAVTGNIANAGLGLTEATGPSGNFAGFTPFVKYLLVVVMLLGRLEVVAVFVLLHKIKNS